MTSQIQRAQQDNKPGEDQHILLRYMRFIFCKQQQWDQQRLRPSMAITYVALVHQVQLLGMQESFQHKWY